MSKRETIRNIFFSFLIMAAVGFGAIFLLLEINLENKLPEPLLTSIVTFAVISAGGLFLAFVEGCFPRLLLNRLIHIKRNVTWGLAGGLANTLLNFPYQMITKQIGIPEGSIVELSHGAPIVTTYLVISIIFLPIVEEIYFRGFIYRLTTNSFDIFWGFVISTLLFVIGHEFDRLEHVFWMIVTCGILTYVYHKTTSVVASAVAHCFSNLIWYSTYYAVDLGWF